MSRILILMRHAKSSWSDPWQADHARPLNKRGRASAKALGGWMKDNALLPDEVLCSTSERTRETLDRLALTPDTAPRFEERLYLAAPNTMWQLLKSATGSTVLMIGHNPGIASFAAELASKPPQHPRFQDYPTGATTVFHFDCTHWQEIQPHTGQIQAFALPRELLA
ncbi:histidine phosphatase family protein [Shimia sp. R11_0]|uniref:SixA phosphatase family protein n=1 Tax=Shimia sp. R11_0 TaxID=2821096 RepID=UPI001ADA4B1E|nr:histidine phosphatase family protein [Shimia sp. R11_0]MBO9476790.1 histidine phosphatase family protein [Shimia sp. R11_0]